MPNKVAFFCRSMTDKVDFIYHGHNKELNNNYSNKNYVKSRIDLLKGQKEVLSRI